MKSHVPFDFGHVEGDLTNEKCALACEAKNSKYKFASTREGREGGECLCSEDHGGYDPNSAEDCSYPCPGDTSQKCGGKEFLMTTDVRPGWARYGCYNDDSSSQVRTIILKIGCTLGGHIY